MADKKSGLTLSDLVSGESTPEDQVRQFYPDTKMSAAPTGWRAMLWDFIAPISAMQEQVMSKPSWQLTEQEQDIAQNVGPQAIGHMAMPIPSIARSALEQTELSEANKEALVGAAEMLSPGPEDVLGPAAGAILAGSPKMIKKFMDVTDELLKKSPLRKSEKWVKKQLDPIVSKKVHHLGEYDPTVELWKERTGTRADPFGTHRRQPDIGEFGETGADVPMPRQTQTTVRQTGTESPIGGRAGTTKHEIEHLLTQEYTSPEDFRRWGAVGGGRSKDMAHPRVKEMTGFDKMTGPQVADETRSMLMQELNTEGAPIRATREQLEILGQEVDIDLFADEDVMKRWRPQSMEDLVPLQQSGWTGSKKEVSQKIKDAFAGVGLKL